MREPDHIPPAYGAPQQPHPADSARLAAPALDASPLRASQAAESDCRSGHYAPQPAGSQAGGVQ